MIERNLDDWLIWSGLALLCYGVYSNWPQMVWFAVGFSLLALGVLYGAGRRG